MPLSEFHPATRSKFESTQSKMNNSMSDLPSSAPDNDFVELLWENGHVVLQGQSSRPRKSSIPSIFSTHPSKLQEKEGREVIAPRFTRFGAVDSAANDFPGAGVSGHNGSNPQDDELVPWLNYPIDDYCLEFLQDFSGANMNSLPAQNSSVQVNKGSSGFSQAGRDSNNVEQLASPKAFVGSSEPGRIRSGQTTATAQQWPSSALNSKSKALDFGAGNSTSTSHNSSWDLPNAKTQKQDLTSMKLPPPPSSSTGLINFSHFSRPVALIKANLQNVDKLKSSNKVSTAASSSPMESTLIESSVGFKSISHGQLVKVSGKGELKSTSQPPQELVSVNHSEAINLEDASRNKNINTNKSRRLSDHVHGQNSGFKAIVPVARHEVEKAPEPVVTSSSVCSGNGASVLPTEPKHRAKRKVQEGEESGYQSEDLEDESTGIKKPATARGTDNKRSRAAEVHNLSERRRRDRINEKMRALQELIPNCNKVDKASMLDEAIEYLKTLQLQVQIMSMGSGLCLPPMMLPAGMQHMRAPHMAHFSPMGVGMGMGLGFGMGILDMNGSPLIPVPPMHGPQFPCSSIPGTPGLPGMPVSNGLQMFGIPGQGLPLSIPRPPFVPLPVHSTRVNTVPEISRATASPVQASKMGPCTNSKDQQIQNLNSEAGPKVGSDDGSQIPSSNEAMKECFEEPSTMQFNNQMSHSSDGAINSSSGNGNSSSGTSYG